MPPQVLILDDFKVSNEITADILNKMGYRTFTCQRSLEAIELLKATKIDVIVTDYFMPGTDGIGFLKQVRNLPGYTAIPIIFLSSTDNPDIVKDASRYSIQGWLKKPVDIKKLTDAINKVITL